MKKSDDLQKSPDKLELLKIKLANQIKELFKSRRIQLLISQSFAPKNYEESKDKSPEKENEYKTKLVPEMAYFDLQIIRNNFQKHRFVSNKNITFKLKPLNFENLNFYKSSALNSGQTSLTNFNKIPLMKKNLRHEIEDLKAKNIDFNDELMANQRCNKKTNFSIAKEEARSKERKDNFSFKTISNGIFSTNKKK